MNFNRYANLVEATNDLTKRGFDASFRWEEGKMTCLECETNYDHHDMKIRELHRFEGFSNPADNSIIFAVECNDGKKGMIISSYGIYAGPEMDEFMKKVEVIPQDKNVNFGARTEDTSRK